MEMNILKGIVCKTFNLCFKKPFRYLYEEYHFTFRNK